MKKTYKNLMEKSFVRSVIIMATGTIGAQIIKMLLSPLITRVYGPDAFGIMGVFMSIIQIIIPIAALTYPMAIVLPKNDLNAKGLIKISIYLSVTIAISITTFLVLFNEKLVELFNIREVSSFLYLIPIVVILTTIMQVSEQWHIRTKQFGINARTTFYQAIIIESSKLGIGLIHPVATVLVILTAMTNGVKAFLLLILGRKSKYQTKCNLKEQKLSLKMLLSKYKDFPLLRAPQAFIEAITQSLPVLLLTSLFGPASAGFFTLCRTVLTLPTTLIGKSIGDVFYPRINEGAQNGEKISSLIIKSVAGLSVVGVVPFGLIIIFGPWLFSFVFGEGWITAGEYARWMAFSSFFRFVNEPCLRSLPVLSAQSFHLISTIIHTIARIIALFLGFYIFNDDRIAIALLGIIGGIINALLIVATFILSKRFEKANYDYTTL